MKQLSCDLCETLEVRKELENQLSRVKSENQTLVKKEQDLAANLANLQVQFQNVAIENTDLKTLYGDLQDVHNQLLETLKGKDEKIDVLKTQINVLAMDTDRLSTQIEELKTNISMKELKYAELKTDYEKLAKENEAAKMVDLTDKDASNQQKNLKASKEKDQTKKKMENLEQANTQLRKDNETFKEQLKEKDKQIRNLHNKYEDEKRNLENEFSRKEKQQKTLENKLCTLKKQTENKNKAIEELQQQNKSLKKKMKEECKQCSVMKAEVQKLKLASDEAIKLQKETDVKCQHKITEMVALMEKHKHQYDKLIEEKDVEMCQLRAKEQETACSRALLEKELSIKHNEMLKLKTELQKEKEEKEKIVKEKTQLKTNIKHKDVQTMFVETPKHSAKIGSIQTSSSFSKRSTLIEKLSQGEPHRNSDNKVTSPWTSSKSCKYSTPKTYSMKTPLKYVKLPHHLNACPEDPAKKKRKVSLDFNFHSDSSDNTDILGLYKKDGIFKNLYMASHDPPDTSTPRKIFTESSINPCLALKVSTMKNMNQAGWAAFPKVDRRRKKKAA